MYRRPLPINYYRFSVGFKKNWRNIIDKSCHLFRRFFCSCFHSFCIHFKSYQWQKQFPFAFEVSLVINEKMKIKKTYSRLCKQLKFLCVKLFIRYLCARFVLHSFIIICDAKVVKSIQRWKENARLQLGNVERYIERKRNEIIKIISHKEA